MLGAYLISGMGRDGTIPENARVPNFRDAGTVTEIPTCLKSGITENLTCLKSGITENLWSGVMKTESRGQAFPLDEQNR